MPPQTSDELIKQYRSIPKGDPRRRQLLESLSEDQRQDIMAHLQGGTLSASAPPQVETPGFLTRTLQGLGLPSTMEEYRQMSEAARPKSITDWTLTAIGAQPIVTLGKMLGAYGQSLYQGAKQTGKEAYEAGYNVGEGGPVGANIGKVAAAATEFGLRDVLGPVGGGPLWAWGEDVSGENYTGAAGDAVSVLINAMMMKGSRPLPAERSLTGLELGAVSQTDKLAFAADLKGGIEDLKTIMPDIEKASGGQPPKTVKQLLESVNEAKRAMNNEAGQAVMPIRNQQYLPIGVANRILSKITPDMAMTAEGQASEKMIRAAALDFQKPWTFEQLDAQRMTLQRDLQGYYEMTPAERTSFLKANPDVAIKLEISGGIKDIVYPAMDQAAGKPPGYFADMKGRQSRLIDLQGTLERRADKLAAQTAQSKGRPLFSEKNMSTYVAGTNAPHPGLSIHRLNPLKPNPEAAANRAVRRAMSGKPSSKAFVYSYPARQVMTQDEKPKPKPPGQQIRDLHGILSDNPHMPIGPEQ